MAETEAYEIAMELIGWDVVANVRADQERITVAMLPEEDEQPPLIPAEERKELLFNTIDAFIEDTLFQYEGECGALERHSVVGGVHNYAIARGNPEFQVHLVR